MSRLVLILNFFAILFSACQKIENPVIQPMNGETDYRNYKPGSFKVLSYNVYQGFQHSPLIQDDFIGWVKNVDPDLVAFQELDQFTQSSLEAFAAKYGHSYAVLLKPDGVPVALTSKFPIEHAEKIVENMHHGYLVAKIRDINVIVVHLSPFSYLKRQQEIRDILVRANQLPKGEQALILGDFNALAVTDSAVYDETYVNRMKDVEASNSNIIYLNNGKIDYSVTGAMKKAGYTDIMASLHPEFQYTIPTVKYKSKYPLRIDYMWANALLLPKVKSIEIIRDDVTDRISDHYPVVAIFDLNKRN